MSYDLYISLSRTGVREVTVILTLPKFFLKNWTCDIKIPASPEFKDVCEFKITMFRGFSLFLIFNAEIIISQTKDIDYAKMPLYDWVLGWKLVAGVGFEPTAFGL